MNYLAPQVSNVDAMQLKNQNGTISAFGTTAKILAFTFLIQETNKLLKTLGKGKKGKKRKKKSK